MTPSLVSVRRARPADAADISRLMSEPEVYGNMLQFPLPSKELWRGRIEEMAGPGRNDLFVVADHGGRVVGSAGLLPQPQPQLRGRHVANLGISVEPAARGPTRRPPL